MALTLLVEREVERLLKVLACDGAEVVEARVLGEAPLVDDESIRKDPNSNPRPKLPAAELTEAFLTEAGHTRECQRGSRETLEAKSGLPLVSRQVTTWSITTRFVLLRVASTVAWKLSAASILLETWRV